MNHFLSKEAIKQEKNEFSESLEAQKGKDLTHTKTKSTLDGRLKHNFRQIILTQFLSSILDKLTLVKSKVTSIFTDTDTFRNLH